MGQIFRNLKFILTIRVIEKSKWKTSTQLIDKAQITKLSLWLTKYKARSSSNGQTNPRKSKKKSRNKKLLNLKIKILRQKKTVNIN